MSPANKTVPDVSGKTIAEARAVIEGQDSSVKRKKSTVIRLQKVGRHSKLIQMQGAQKEQSRIDLIISKGPNSFENAKLRGETRAKQKKIQKNTIKYQAK